MTSAGAGKAPTTGDALVGQDGGKVAMADSKTAQEPSMEEILSSIRRIIAEDEPGGRDGRPGADGGAAVGRADADDEDDDVLELTEVVGEPEPSAAPIPPAAATAAPRRANHRPSPTCWRARRCPPRPSIR